MKWLFLLLRLILVMGSRDIVSVVVIMIIFLIYDDEAINYHNYVFNAAYYSIKSLLGEYFYNFLFDILF